ncbi:MAG: DUF1648 domain-containing protein [Anaerolineales bacterium]|nr:DUF1648 domain-containing protein [Anaerolineales bacterium]
MEQKPPARLGLTFGLGIILILALLDIGFIVLTLTTPITPLLIVRMLLVMANLAVSGITLYGLISLNGARYSMDRNRLVIHWGATTEIIPLLDVEQILSGSEAGAVLDFRGLRWPGFWAGKGTLDGIGKTRFYCATPIEQQLIIVTKNTVYAISPENPEKFLHHFSAQQNMQPSTEFQQTTLQPTLPTSGLISDPVAHRLLAIGAGLCLALFSYVTAVYGRLPRIIPLHFGLVGIPDRFGIPLNLLSLAGLGALAWMINGALGVIIYLRWKEKIAAYLLWGASTGLQILLWVAISGLT